MEAGMAERTVMTDAAKEGSAITEAGKRSPKNKTLQLLPSEIPELSAALVHLDTSAKTFRTENILNKIVHADLFEILPALPRAFADLLFIDPPYNIDKDFHGARFKETSAGGYASYIESWLPGVLDCAKEDASIYICGDWKSTPQIYAALEKRTIIRNRITWQREKGRKANANWKNCSEDIWYATMGKSFYFNADAVMHRKKVLAPYRDNGEPKDWTESEDGKFRLTGPSNFWDDITVPYWSMSENTDHPTQKPEKLLAKLILASTKPGGVVFDPFAGSGSTAAAAKKLGRNYVCVEQNELYCLWAAKRAKSAEEDARIQGFHNGVFLERNARL